MTTTATRVSFFGCGKDLGKNKFEWFCESMPKPFFEAFESVLKTSTTPVHVYLKKTDIITFGDMSHAKMLAGWDKIAEQSCGEFFCNANTTSFVSATDAITAIAPDGTLRPSIFTGKTYDFHHKEWNSYMHTMCSFSHVKDDLHLVAYLAKRNHQSKDFAVEDLMVHFMAFEAVACGLVREAAYEADMVEEDLLFLRNIDDDRDKHVFSILKRYLPHRDVLFLTCVSCRLCKMLTKDGDVAAVFQVVMSIDTTEEDDDGVNDGNTIVLVNKHKFSSCVEHKTENIGDVCLVVTDKTTDEKLVLLVARHDNALISAEIIKWVDKTFSSMPCIIALDMEFDNDRRFAEFCTGVLAIGMEVQGKEKPTICRKRTSLTTGKLGSVAADDTSCKKGSVFVTNFRKTITVACDNTGIGEFVNKLMPNQEWPMPRAAIHMNIVE